MASQEMIQQLKKPKRNLGFLKINFNIIDPDTNPTMTTNNEEIFSDFDKIKEEEILQTKNYATLEKNFWVLDNSQTIYGSEELDQTYISSFMSNENCILENKPTFTFTSNIYLTTLGLTMMFDSIDENFVKKLNVKAYRDETIILDKDYTISDFKDRVIFADNEQLVRWNKIIITFLETNLPYRRVRINQLLFGIKEVYTDDNIFSAESKEKTTMINSELPTHTFKFTIDNYNKLFNPDNPVGWYRYILQRQPITYNWGYQLDDGTIEWILGGNMMLTGAVDVSDNKVTFNTTSLINYLTKVYKKGIYNSNGKSLYDLAVDVLSDNNITSEQYSLWVGLKNMKTDAPLPILESRQLLQIIATAGNCVLYTDRENIIHIKPFVPIINPDILDYNFGNSKPNIKIQTELHDSIIYINHYSFESVKTELFKNEKLNINGITKIEIEYDLAIDVEASITNGTIISSNFYGRYGVLEINNTSNEPVSLVIEGKKAIINQTTDSMNFNLDGEDMEYKNDLVTNMLENSKTTKLKEFIGKWYNYRNIYSFDNRGDIVKNTRELVKLQTDFSDALVGYLVENNIKYNGAWSGSSTIMKVSDNDVAAANIQ